MSCLEIKDGLVGSQIFVSLGLIVKPKNSQDNFVMSKAIFLDNRIRNDCDMNGTLVNSTFRQLVLNFLERPRRRLGDHNVSHQVVMEDCGRMGIQGIAQAAKHQASFPTE